MLRLVGHAPPSPPSSRRRPDALSLTAEEVRHLRAALRNAERAYGGPDVLAAVLGVPRKTIYRAHYRRNLSGTFAIRVAAAAGISVEAVLTGAMEEASRCPTCGHRVGG